MIKKSTSIPSAARAEKHPQVRDKRPHAGSEPEDRTTEWIDRNSPLELETLLWRQISFGAIDRPQGSLLLRQEIIVVQTLLCRANA
jgi:hypothetical protein